VHVADTNLPLYYYVVTWSVICKKIAFRHVFAAPSLSWFRSCLTLFYVASVWWLIVHASHDILDYFRPLQNAKNKPCMIRRWFFRDLSEQNLQWKLTLAHRCTIRNSNQLAETKTMVQMNHDSILELPDKTSKCAATSATLNKARPQQSNGLQWCHMGFCFQVLRLKTTLNTGRKLGKPWSRRCQAVI